MSALVHLQTLYVWCNVISHCVFQKLIFFQVYHALIQMTILNAARSLWFWSQNWRMFHNCSRV